MEDVFKKVAMQMIAEKIMFGAKAEFRRKEKAGLTVDDLEFDYATEEVVDKNSLGILEALRLAKELVNNYEEIRTEVWSDAPEGGFEDDYQWAQKFHKIALNRLYPR